METKQCRYCDLISCALHLTLTLQLPKEGMADICLYQLQCKYIATSINVAVYTYISNKVVCSYSEHEN